MAYLNDSYQRNSPFMNRLEDELPVTLHPLYIGNEIVLCMPEVNKVLRNVYQVLSQANYYLSKHRISSKRYTGPQLMRMKVLGILGHEAKVCSYILQHDAEKIFNSFDMNWDCRNNDAIKWMEPVILDRRQSDSPNKTVEPVDTTPGLPVSVNQFKLGNDTVVCTPDILKVLQIKCNPGSTTGYYYAKNGITPYRFEKLEHLHKIKDLGIIKSSATHCTYVLKEEALKVFEGCGLNEKYLEDNIKFLDLIDLGEAPSHPIKDVVNIKQEESLLSPRTPAYRNCFSPESNGSGRKSFGDIEDDERLMLMKEDMTVHVFVVENQEVVCMPDIHKIVQNIHGNSIQVNYYFNKLKVQKKRFCFAHLRELKSRNILQNNATYCTYVSKHDAEKLFQIHYLVDDPKLNDIKWTEPIDLDIKIADVENGTKTDPSAPVEDFTVQTLSIDNELVITTPDVHRIVDYLEGQSASLDYHFRKLGISKYRFTYSQLHQLRRLNAIKRPTVCTFVSKKDVDRLLKRYETERNKPKIRAIKFLSPVLLVPGSNPAKFQVNRPEDDASISSSMVTSSTLRENPKSLERSHSIESEKHPFPSPNNETHPDNNNQIYPSQPNGEKKAPSVFQVPHSQSQERPNNPYHDTSVQKNQNERRFFHEQKNLPFTRPNENVYSNFGPDMMSPTSKAMAHLQTMHPSIDCPIVIPNGDYDPLKVAEPNNNFVNGNGKRAYPADNDPNHNKRPKGLLFVFQKAMHEKCPNTEFFLVRIFLYLD